MPFRLDVVDVQGEALWTAARFGDTERVIGLIRQGADINYAYPAYVPESRAHLRVRYGAAACFLFLLSPATQA